MESSTLLGRLTNCVFSQGEAFEKKVQIVNFQSLGILIHLHCLAKLLHLDQYLSFPTG
jgi:hypothetical protein